MNYKNRILDILKSNDRAMLSSELQEALSLCYPNLKSDNARKQLQLCKESDGIYKSKIKFEHGQLAYDYIPLGIGSPRFKDLVLQRKPLLSRVINRLRENNGVISYGEISKLCGCPITKSSSKTKSIENVIEELGMVLELRKQEYKGYHFVVNGIMDEKFLRNACNKIIEDAWLDCKFIPSVLVWLQKANIMSEKPKYRNKNNPLKFREFNNLLWDAYGYSKATGFLHRNTAENDKFVPTFLEVKLYSIMTYDDVMGFYERVQIVINKAKSGKNNILPIIVTRTVEKEAERVIKNLGILHFNIAAIFGEHIFEVMNDVRKINFFEALKSEDKPKDIKEAISNVLTKIDNSGQNVNLGNIKGELFERIICDVSGQIFNRRTDMIKPSFKFGDYEYDILIETDKEYIVVEVKGWKSTSIIPWGEYDASTGKPEKETLKWFFDHKLPLIKKHLKENYNKQKPVKACYITTAKFEYKGEEEMKKIKKLVSNEIGLYYDGEALIKYLKEKGAKRDAEIIEKFYINV